MLKKVNAPSSSAGTTLWVGNVGLFPSPLGALAMRSFASTSDASASFEEESAEYSNEIADIEAEYNYRKARRQALVGVVISNSAAKSITVDVRRPRYMSKYDKVIYRKRMFMAHDENEDSKPGDVVRIVPCPPKSRKKRHTLIAIVKKGVDLKELEEAAASRVAD